MSEQTVPKKKSNKLLIIIVVVLLAACCGLGYLVLSGTLSSGNKKPPKVYTANLGEFVVNLSDESPTYIKATVTIGYTNKKGTKTITNKLSQIKDCVNKFMLSKSSADFRSDTIDATGKELITKINEAIDSQLITDIYFEQIIIQ